MAIVMLPEVSLDTSPTEALSLMVRARRGGVVVHTESNLLLVEGARLIEARRDFKRMELVTQYGRGLVHVQTAQTPPDMKRGFGFEGIPSNVTLAMIAVSIGDLKMAQRVSAEIVVFYCDGPRRHSFLPGEVNPPQQCPNCEGVIRGR